MYHLQASLHFLPPETTTKCFGNSHIHTHTLWIQKMQILLNHFAVHSWKMHLQNYSLDFQYDSNYDLYAFCHQNYHKSVQKLYLYHLIFDLTKLYIWLTALHQIWHMWFWAKRISSYNNNKKKSDVRKKKLSVLQKNHWWQKIRAEIPNVLMYICLYFDPMQQQLDTANQADA